jgi:hypothetical protein
MHKILKYFSLFVMMKVLKIFLVLLLFVPKIYAQDAVVISEGNFVRGTIQGTNFSTVAILEDDQTVKQYQAKDVQSFLWNGATYESKPIVINKKMEFKFFRLIEAGNINLFSFGEKASTQEPIEPQRTKIKPSFSVGVGSGGYGGGLGGGVSIGGGGRRDDEPQINIPKLKAAYFLEKPGTGPMQEINLANKTAVKNILLQKMGDDEDLSQRIKNTDSFDVKTLIAFVMAYNAVKN